MCKGDQNARENLLLTQQQSTYNVNGMHALQFSCLQENGYPGPQLNLHYNLFLISLDAGPEVESNGYQMTGHHMNHFTEKLANSKEEGETMALLSYQSIVQIIVL